LQAESNAELTTFAVENEETSLGGLAYLRIAHRRYEEGEFEQAAEQYDKAAEILANTVFAERARLGRAMAMLRADRTAEGLQALKELADNANILDSTRAEAAYNRAIKLWEEGDLAGAHAEIDRIRALPQAGFWSFRADQLADRMPPLPDSPEEG
jgi:predicted negative regulator of RcsB-dependent stress response